MVDIPTTINYLSPVVNAKVLLPICVPAHKVAVEVFCKSDIAKLLVP